MSWLWGVVYYSIDRGIAGQHMLFITPKGSYLTIDGTASSPSYHICSYKEGADDIGVAEITRSEVLALSKRGIEQFT
jgi:hypothetical protein